MGMNIRYKLNGLDLSISAAGGPPTFKDIIRFAEPGLPGVNTALLHLGGYVLERVTPNRPPERFEDPDGEVPIRDGDVFRTVPRKSN